MGQREILLTIVNLLNHYNIPYLLTGSLASSYYGYPRATHDIDFLIETSQEHIKKLPKALSTLGNEFIVDSNQARNAVESSSQCNIYHTDSGIKIDFWIIKKTDFGKKYSRQRFMEIRHRKITLISPEDLVINKLVWCKELFSERHLYDCAGILAIQKNNLDRVYLEHEAKARKVESLLQQAEMVFKE